jgi:hypothetical protein
MLTTSAEVKIEWTYTSTLLFVFVTCVGGRVYIFQPATRE